VPHIERACCFPKSDGTLKLTLTPVGLERKPITANEAKVRFAASATQPVQRPALRAASARGLRQRQAWSAHPFSCEAAHEPQHSTATQHCTGFPATALGSN
jgi:hypothetical protein